MGMDEVRSVSVEEGIGVEWDPVGPGADRDLIGPTIISNSQDFGELSASNRVSTHGNGQSRFLRSAGPRPVTDTATDQELVQRVQRGDKAAFDLLVAKYQRKIGSLVSRFVYDHAEVADITQEAFIKAYRAIGDFRGDSAFYTWLYRIAVNTAKNHLVSLGRRPPATDIEAEDAEQSAIGQSMQVHATPEGQLLTREIAETVTRAIEGLPEDLRTAITLRELDGLSYEEIAQAMDCPIGTVRSRIFRARETIDEALKPLLD
jgi:RNA polymerase sigma-70 factor (ECF subfamily)